MIFHAHKVQKFDWGLSTILHVHEVEKFNRRTLRYFMPMKWKSLTGVFYYISCPQSGKF